MELAWYIFNRLHFIPFLLIIFTFSQTSLPGLGGFSSSEDIASRVDLDVWTQREANLPGVRLLHPLLLEQHLIQGFVQGAGVPVRLPDQLIHNQSIGFLDSAHCLGGVKLSRIWFRWFSLAGRWPWVTITVFIIIITTVVIIIIIIVVTTIVIIVIIIIVIVIIMLGKAGNFVTHQLGQ